MLGVSIFLGCEKLNQEGETNTPFTITSIGNTLVTLYRGWPGGIPVEGLPNGVYLEYRKGKENWQTVNYSCFELSDGEYVQFRAQEKKVMNVFVEIGTSILGLMRLVTGLSKFLET